MVLPHFFAWLEIRWLSGNLWLQLAVGTLAALASALGLADVAARDRELPAARRAAGAFLAVFAVLWLGNVRTLTHTGELMHVYITLSFLVLALRLALAARGSARPGLPLAGALLAALAATLSLGHGLASFVGVLSLLALARAGRAQIAAAGGGLVAATLLYFGMRGGEGVSGSLQLEPLANLLTAARWLGSPVYHLLPFLWEDEKSFLIPVDSLARAARAVSALVRAQAGEAQLAVWPQALAGGGGMLALGLASWRTWRATEAAPPTRLLGLGLAWFGLAAAAIVSLARLSYFAANPGQIYANRYLPWPCLFWLGLAWAALGRRGPAGRCSAATAVFALACALPLLAQPSESSGRIYASFVYGHVENTGAGVAVGVLDRHTSLGESDPAEVLRGAPVLRRARVSPFHWREFALLDQPLPAHALRFPAVSVEAAPVDNLFGGAGSRVTLRSGPGVRLPARVMLADGQGRVRGIAVRDPRAGRGALTGWVRGTPEGADLRVAALP